MNGNSRGEDIFPEKRGSIEGHIGDEGGTHMLITLCVDVVV